MDTPAAVRKARVSTRPACLGTFALLLSLFNVSVRL